MPNSFNGGLVAQLVAHLTPDQKVKYSNHFKVMTSTAEFFWKCSISDEKRLLHLVVIVMLVDRILGMGNFKISKGNAFYSVLAF